MSNTEFQINTYTTSDQRTGSITSLSDGGFVVTWGSYGQDGDDWGIFGQRFDSSGNTLGSEFQINTYTTNWQYIPSIAGLSDGGFVVTWRSDGQDGDDWGIFGQRFDANGDMVERISSNAPTIDTFMGDNVLTYAEKSSFVLSGTAEAGSTVALEYSGPFGVSASLPVTVADGSGVWSLSWQSIGSPPVYDFLPDGDYEITATATDAAGNTLVGTTKTVSLNIWADTSSSEYTIPSVGDAIEHIGGDASVTAASPVYSVGDGIYVQNTGTGEISIIASSSVQGAGDDGIQVWNAATATNVRISAVDVIGLDEGIVASNNGTGSTTITATGQITGGSGQQDQTVNADGITADNSTTTTNLRISAVNVTGLDDGIRVSNRGTGVLSINLTGNVISTSTDTSDGDYSYGIRSWNLGTHSTVTTSGDVTSNDRGIYSWNEGSGALSITSTGDVTALAGNGIFAENADWSSGSRAASSATDITITAHTVTAYGHGIDSQNWGTGSTTITATGTVKGGVGEADQTKDVDGIYANNKGSGSLSISVSGDVTSTSTDKSDADFLYGIYASGSGTDIIVSTAGDVISNDRGILLLNYGSGSTSLTSHGKISTILGPTEDNPYGSSSAWHNVGIYALNHKNSTAKDITINANQVESYGAAIWADNQGTGSTYITTTGQITGGLGQTTATMITMGIYAWNEPNAKNIEIVAKDVIGLEGAISVINLGKGSTDIIASGNVEAVGASGEGIKATDASSSITVTKTASVYGITEGIETDSKADTVTVNGSVTGLNGTAILLGGGNDTVNLGTTATITGTIDGGTGSDTASFSVAKSAVDTFTYNDTTKIAVVTVVSTVTTFKDFEYFKFSDDTSAMTTAEAVTT